MEWYHGNEKALKIQHQLMKIFSKIRNKSVFPVCRKFEV